MLDLDEIRADLTTMADINELVETGSDELMSHEEYVEAEKEAIAADDRLRGAVPDLVYEVERLRAMLNWAHDQLDKQAGLIT